MRTARKQQCSRVLRNTFGVSGFRPGQEQAADALLDGRDLLCILPTGAGKSLCWQLPALMMDELTVVISPLIVLMHDQVRHLRERGIPSVHLDSLMTPAERADALNQLTRGQAKIAFLAPERLNHPEIHALCQQRPPAMVVVDEAHCVVQWGDAFRPSYQQIGQFVSSLPRRPVLCAMTATADKQLQRGIVQSLGLRHPKRIVMPVERPNLHYSVLPTVHVTDAILRALQKIPGKAVVFCRLRARTESLAERLNRAGIPAAAYHAGLNREERSRVVQAYLSGRIRVVTATSAFGMGVDIPDIRLILHDHLPTNMIDYVQQSGRAGRDGETAYALLLFSPADLLRFHTRCQQIRLQHKHRPFTQYALIQREWRPYRRVLRFCLQAPCLSQGISAAFGQKSAPCGNCSACRSGAIGKEIPNIPRMTVQELYCWILQLHRDELHRRNPHQKQATNAQLREIAETMQLPDNLPGRETYFPYLRAFHTISRLKRRMQMAQVNLKKVSVSSIEEPRYHVPNQADTGDFSYYSAAFTASNACSKSAIMSSMCSVPMDRRIVFCAMP